jgi:glycogen phosphorylase
VKQGLVMDPVCGMRIDRSDALPFTREGRQYYFCSDYCRRIFEAEPQRYSAEPAGGEEDMPAAARIAYFSMEVAADPQMPTYSGGLGVLAGDMLRTCADLRLPVVGVSLLYRCGYFEQRIDHQGTQREEPATWDVTAFVQPLAPTVNVFIEGRAVAVRAWQFDITGATGHRIPLILLDTDCAANSRSDRELTAWLYGGDEQYRLAQEVVLGIGGVRMLRALGYGHLQRFHMNEGHAALLAVELLNEPGAEWDFDAARSRCVFTTHTPVPAGHDQFPYDLFQRVWTEPVPIEPVRMLAGGERLNMTLLGLNTSRYVNGVARKHGEVSRGMFPSHPIDSITNGVHSYTWTCDSFRRLYDRHIPGWEQEPSSLRYAIRIPRAEVWEAHSRAKFLLVEEVRRRGGTSLSTEAFTIGIARRATAYKRLDLILSHPGQLAEIAQNVGPLQLVFAGKAHPRDHGGKETIRRIVSAADALRPELVNVVYLENYDISLAKLLTAGVDLWLNTPVCPLEASGTSGMKAAHNGVPSFSVLDGWWAEGHAEGVTGWSIGPETVHDGPVEDANRQDAQDLYRKLGAVIAPMFYNNREEWVAVMRQAIAFNASFFNTHRMVRQYAASAYL